MCSLQTYQPSPVARTRFSFHQDEPILHKCGPDVMRHQRRRVLRVVRASIPLQDSLAELYDH